MFLGTHCSEWAVRYLFTIKWIYMNLGECLHFESLFKKWAGKTRAVQESRQKCGPSVRFWVREGAFLAMKRQCAGEFYPLFEQPLGGMDRITGE